MTKRLTPNLTPLVEDPSQSQFMRELLEAGRGASAAGYDFERGLSKHLALVDAGAPMPKWAEGLRPATGAGGAAAGSSMIAWLAVPVALVALTSAVVLVSRQSASPSSPATRGVTPSAPAPSASSAAPVVAPAAVPAPASGTGARATTAAVPHTPRAKHVALAPLKPAQAPLARLATEGGAGNAKSSVKPAGGELFETAQPAVASAQPGGNESAPAAAPAQAQQPAKPEQQAARPPPPPQPAVQDDARLEREMAMLAVAQRALQSDPNRSLGLARQGETEFAGSMFTQERQQVVLLALVKLGRMDEARRLAKPYLARYPHGPFSDRVRHALATGMVER